MTTIEYMRQWRARNKDKIQSYHEEYRNRHRAMINKRVREWKRAHRDDEHRKLGREAYYRNHDNRLLCARNWRKRNPEYCRKMRDNYRDQLADHYVIKTLTHKTSLCSSDIPTEIVNAKREVMRLRRKINEQR